MQNVQFIAKSFKRHFNIQGDKFDSKHFGEVNQFTEDSYVNFYPLEDLLKTTGWTWMGDDHEIVADIDG